MEFSRYQYLALETDRITDRRGRGATVPLLGLAGETGSLVTAFKKELREGGAPVSPAFVREELGDILWYVANLASRYEIDLNEVASFNLQKVMDRFVAPEEEVAIGRYDEDFPRSERLPRKLQVLFSETTRDGMPFVAMRRFQNGRPIGDPLNDNAREPDDYRYHDIFHLGLMAHLGWSPVVRKLLGKKRKSDALTDEVEDGARAQILEEAVVAVIWEYARQEDFLQASPALDGRLLDTVRDLVSSREVRTRTRYEWERCVRGSCSAYVRAKTLGDCVVTCDMRKARLTVRSAARRSRSAA